MFVTKNFFFLLSSGMEIRWINKKKQFTLWWCWLTSVASEGIKLELPYNAKSTLKICGATKKGVYLASRWEAAKRPVAGEFSFNNRGEFCFSMFSLHFLLISLFFFLSSLSPHPNQDVHNRAVTFLFSSNFLQVFHLLLFPFPISLFILLSPLH